MYKPGRRYCNKVLGRGTRVLSFSREDWCNGFHANSFYMRARETLRDRHLGLPVAPCWDSAHRVMIVRSVQASSSWARPLFHYPLSGGVFPSLMRTLLLCALFLLHGTQPSHGAMAPVLELSRDAPGGVSKAAAPSHRGAVLTRASSPKTPRTKARLVMKLRAADLEVRALEAPVALLQTAPIGLHLTLPLLCLTLCRMLEPPNGRHQNPRGSDRPEKGLRAGIEIHVRCIACVAS